MPPDDSGAPQVAVASDLESNQSYGDSQESGTDRAKAQVLAADITKLCQHVAMLHKRWEGLTGKLIVSSFGQNPDTGENLPAINVPFEIGDVDGMVAKILELNAQTHRNVYVAPAVFRAGRRAKEEVVAVFAVVADFDDSEAHRWRERLPLEPDYVLETSAGRFQAFFWFDKPASPEEANSICVKLKAFANCDHGTGDYSHVWRVPGTVNWPNQKKVREGRSRDPQVVKVVVECGDLLTDPDDLDRLLPALATTTKPTKPKAAVVVADIDDDDFDVDDFDVPSFLHGLPPTLRNKIRAKPGANSDRSTDIFAVVQSLLKKNLSDSQIAKVIEDFPEGIGEKYVGRSDLMTEIARIRTKPPTSPDLVVGAGGQPLANLANARILLRRKDWVGVLKFNEFANRIEIHKKAPVDLSIADHVDGALVWNDACDTLVSEWMQHQGVGVKSNLVAEAVEVTARENGYHPVREYLDGLHWDGRPRLDTWAIDYLGATDSPYTRAVSPAWMIGGVARIYEPGTKMDYAVILEGPQGLGKSSTFRVLGGDYFSDEVGDTKSKDTLVTLHAGNWIVEMGELDGMNKSDVRAFKQFITKQSDFFRPPYGRRSRNFRRSFVFCGTTNDEEYLKDATGGRRFWPIACTRIDIEGLQAVRDQLWAEAADRFRNGERWWLDKAAEKLAQIEQRARYQHDEWEDDVMVYASSRTGVTTKEVLRGPLMLFERRDWNTQNSMRVAKILRSNGWVLNTSVRPRRYERPANLGKEVGREMSS